MRVRWWVIGRQGVVAAALVLLVSCNASVSSAQRSSVRSPQVTLSNSEEERVAIASYSVSAITEEVVENGTVTGYLDFGKDRGAWYSLPSFFTCRSR